MWPYAYAIASSVINRTLNLLPCLINYAASWFVALILIHLFISCIPGDAGKYLQRLFSNLQSILCKLVTATWKGAAILLRTLLSGAKAVVEAIMGNHSTPKI